MQLARILKTIVALTLLSATALNTNAQEKGSLRLLDWKPKSQMVVPVTNITKPKFPVIDIHNHLGDLESTSKYLQEMDKAGVVSAVSLDGHSKNFFYKEHIKKAQSVPGNRIIVF